MLPPANILLSSGLWLWVALLAAALLLPLAWRTFRRSSGTAPHLRWALALRLVGIALVLFCLIEPQWVSPRAKRGANAVVLLGDNSQGLQITESGAPQSRGEFLKGALTEPNSTWQSKLADEFQVRSYVFDRALRRVPGFQSLDFSGDRSSLGRALQELRQRFAGQPLAAVLLFTDGNATDLDGQLENVNGLPPIYPVVIGTPGTTRDLRIERADVRQTAFDDAPVSLRTRLSSHRVSNQTARLSLRPLPRVVPADENTAGDTPIESREVRLPADGSPADVVFEWRPSGSGIQFYDISADPDGSSGSEATLLNNRRRLLVDRGRPTYRILYVSGRPSWDYKFLNRAVQEDPQLQMVGLIRVAKREPKFEFKGRAGEAANPLFRGFGRGEDETARYDQPVLVRVSARDENELRGGFPVSAEELFAYDAVIVDDLEAAFFTHDQQEMLRRFAAERGGGMLFLGGADALENGGYAGTPVAAALPLHLDRAGAGVPQGELSWTLTREGWVEPWTRVRANEADERERLQKMPSFLVLNGLQSIKPGATALATAEDRSGNVYPSLVSQRFGAGRVAAMTVGDFWRWGLRGENEQADLARFWRQLARWLVTETPAPISLRLERAADGESATLRTIARDADFKPLDSAQVSLTIKRVDATPAPGAGTPFSAVTLPAEPVADRPGEFTATLSLRDAGAYIAETEVKDLGGKIVGTAEAGWVNDPLAEEFATLDPNRTLMEELARKTGGEVLELSQLSQFADRLPKLAAPIMEPRSWPLWHQSWVLLLVLLCFVAEWTLRRWKGLP